jgi:hypothetical protein
MKLREIEQILDAKILSSVKDTSQVSISMACGADLMSDVLAFVKSGTLLLTGLTTLQVIYTAENAGVQVICFVRGKTPNDNVVTLARQKGIVLMATKDSMFESCGKLYNNGIKGCFDLSKKTSVNNSITD